MFGTSSIQERRRYYREEWSEKDIPDFIADGITKREFGFDHLGHGPNDRYKVISRITTLFSDLPYNKQQ